MTAEKKLWELYQQSAADNDILAKLYQSHDVKRGLRNQDGSGIVFTLTRICDVVGSLTKNGIRTEVPGELHYRGIDIKDLAANASFKPGTFEEVCFLLLFGKLPTMQEYQDFTAYLRQNYLLPAGFTTNGLVEKPTSNIMNTIQRTILRLYQYDDDPDSVAIEHTLLRGLSLLAQMPGIITIAYQEAVNDQPSYTYKPAVNHTIAENILSHVRLDNNFSIEEAELLDILMAIQADHGSGNNSTFANIVVSSSGTDLYSALTAAVGSLKGPRHGGANEKVRAMMNEAAETLGLEPSDEQLEVYIAKLINKTAFDKTGLIYGIGHAVYTISDPRAEILCAYCEKFAKDTEHEKKFMFYRRFEETALAYIKALKQRSFCINVDFYSGLACEMLGLPNELYLPIFTTSRVAGWLAHNLENKLYNDKIVRPTAKFIGVQQKYIKVEDRKQ